MKEMKKLILFGCLYLGLQNSTDAQVYLKVYSGYALPVGENMKLTSRETINGYMNGQIYDRTHESSYQWKLGQGYNFGLNAGYAINKYIGLEITGNVQISPKFHYSNPFLYRDNFSPTEGTLQWSSIGFFGNLEYSGSFFQLSPQLVLLYSPYNSWTFYLKGGPNLIRVKHKQTTQRPEWNTIAGAHEPAVFRVVEFSGKMSVGLQFSFGAEYTLSKHLAIFGEITPAIAKYKFTKSKTLQYKEDGIDQLSQLENVIRTNLDEQTDFSHIGLNIGVKYYFTKK